MPDNTRTRKVALNAGVALACQFASLLFAFINRYVFIHTLGNEYLGVRGLFSSVLLILSFAELGIGNAIIFSMYKPLATGDKEKIKSLMALYQKAYRIIGLVVAVAGLAMVPFLNFLVTDAPDITENIALLYLLYLADTVVSYFFIYKRSIIIADQRSYVTTLYSQATGLGLCIAQIAILLITRNFILYLVLQILATLVNNVLTSWKADRDYPYLKKEKAAPLEPAERKHIFKNVRALVMYKFGTVVLTGTDNILIARLINLDMVGLTSNYLLLIATLKTVISKLMEAVTASIGNVNAVESAATKKSVFDKMFFITAWIHGFLSVGMLLLFQEFISLWLGADFVLAFPVVVAMVLHFYELGVHQPAYTYRITLGYFVQGQAAPVLAAVLNIILSILLGLRFGVAGIFFATSIARFFTLGIVDPVLIYRNSFGVSPWVYYGRYFAYIGLFAALYFLLFWVVGLVTVSGVTGFVLRGVIITVLFNGIMLLLLGRTSTFRELWQMAKGLIRHKQAGRKG